MNSVQDYAYWHTMLQQPGVYVDPEHQGPLNGYWRLIGARTKADYPVAIWKNENGEEVIKVGRKAEFLTASHDGADFLASGWPKCVACTEEAYTAAIEGGFWADGKPSRIVSDAVKLGLDLGAGATGGNAPPSYELLSQQLDELVAKARDLQITDQESADKAKVLADRIHLVWKEADSEREKEKKPHDLASSEVQAKWMAHMQPARDARTKLMNTLQQWLAAEQRKREEAAAAENERRRQAAIAQWNEDLETLSDEDFLEKYGKAKPRPEPDAPAEEVAPEPELNFTPVAAEKVTAGGAFTRNTSAKKKKVAEIVDMDKLYAALKDEADFIAFMQKKADAALRAKITLPGVKVVEV